MTYRWTVLAIVAGLVLSASAPGPHKFHVRESDSRVTFTLSKWTVFKEEGRFTEFDGRILYEPDKPEEMDVTFTVDVRSIDTRNNGRDRRLMEEDFFDAAKFPVMEFRSDTASIREDGWLDVTGTITIKGTSREITIPVRPLGISRVADLGTIAGFETEFQVNRMDFDVTGHRWSDGRNILGHVVDVRLLVSASSR